MSDSLPKCKYMREVWSADPLDPVDNMCCAFKDGNGELVSCVGVLNCAKYAEDLDAFPTEKSTFDPVSHPSHYTEGREYEPNDKSILFAITNLMIQIHSAESYKIGLISEEEYKKYLRDEHERLERLIKEVQNND